jgi:hypothetical protein
MLRPTPIRRLLAGSFVLSLTTPCAAWDAVAYQTKVRVIEVSYMPSFVTFQIDKAAGTCAPGAWLTYNAPLPMHSSVSLKEGAVRAVLSALLAAQAANTALNVHLNQTGCIVEYLHLGNQ